MENKKITVFGATGKIGSLLLQHLSYAKVATVAVTRNLENVVSLPFIEWKKADISDIESLYATMEASEAVFLLSGLSANFVEEQKNVIKAAKQCGVKHIVKLSSGAADKNSSFYIPQTHGIIENFLIESGMHYTMLRPNGIMQNWLGDIAESVKKERRFQESTGSGKRAYVDARDIAEVAFKCLTSAELHYDKIYLLTCDKAVNYYDVANAISSAIDEKVTYIPISLEQARQEMGKAGMPQTLIDTFISYDTAQRNGETEIISDNVKTILGKPARTLEEFVKDYVGKFK
ncbi:NmrA family NAD(P)-binding protein [Soonwooa sp.]|uniref:NmrA family NAD(P)-binding protein n=1 Tax=Soonwooa sp. TaxID=1938592 RepID=UPI0026329ED0|nr:NmrA family NAD(P)-binding protein [Soonwooa sp.]